VALDLVIRNGIEAALRVVCDIKNPKSLIDVGAGGDHHHVIDFKRKFQIVYASNVLEHSRNVGNFIEKLFDICEDDGYVAIMVPRPHLNRLLSGHITTWSTATLVYNIVAAGYDCSQAKVCNGVMEKSILVQKRPIRNDPAFVYRTGVVDDVTQQSKFFPWDVRHKGAGWLPSVNWGTTYKLPKTRKFDVLSMKYLTGQTYTVKDGGTLDIPQDKSEIGSIGVI